eukprot:symbB.v1.2.001715.t1/scaffold61.1/size362833/14
MPSQLGEELVQIAVPEDVALLLGTAPAAFEPRFLGQSSAVQMDSSQASLAATAQLRLGAVIEGSASRDLSPVDETKVMAWRPKCRRARGKGILGKSDTQHSTGLQPRPAWSNLLGPELTVFAALDVASFDVGF